MRIGPLAVDVQASKDKAFDVFTDLERATERTSAITNIEILTDGGVGQGTRWAETRKMFGKEHTEELEIIEFAPPNAVGIRCESCGVDYRFRYTFEDNGQATHVELTGVGKPLTLMSKLMAPVGWVFAGPMKKAMLKDMEELRAAAETGA